MFEELTSEERRDLVVQQALFIGVLGFGVAAGAHVGLGHLQGACIEAGALPKPGARVMAGDLYKSSQCWESALFLQRLANGGAIGGALSLLGGGVLDQHPDKLSEVYHTMRGHEVEQ